MVSQNQGEQRIWREEAKREKEDFISKVSDTE